jgi:hypothetical protein
LTLQKQHALSSNTRCIKSRVNAVHAQKNLHYLLEDAILLHKAEMLDLRHLLWWFYFLNLKKTVQENEKIKYKK